MAALYYRGRFLPALPLVAGLAYGAAGLDAPEGSAVTSAELSGGRCIMSRSGVFYAARAMERVAAGTATDGVPGVPAGRAVARRARTAAHFDGGIFSVVRRALAGVRRGVGGVRGQSGRRLGGAARAD